MQPAGEFPARKCKEIEGNPRKKACISLDSFGGIDTFQRVTAKTIKKIPLKRNCTRKKLSPSLAAAPDQVRRGARLFGTRARAA
jgi:hypothetical protein